MKRRMYLKGLVRGVGIGMVLTALIMGMTEKAKQPLTDAEVRAKALALGMVDPNSLSLSNVGASSGASQSGGTGDDTKQPDDGEGMGTGQTPDETQQPEDEGDIMGTGNSLPETTEPAATQDESQRTEEPQTASPIQTPAPSQIPAPSQAPTPSQTPEVTPTPVVEKDTITIVIVRGDSSYTVSRRLEEAGLIESAREYDSYLVDNGYSKTIHTGTYKIPLDATWEEIADIIA